MPSPLTFTATRGDAGERLDRTLGRCLAGLPGATRTRVQTWIREGAVQVNGRPVQRPAARAAPGDRITVHVPERDLAPPRAPMTAEPMPLAVIHEDEHLLAVTKPAGMVCHPTYRHPTGTLMNGLLWRARGWPATQRPSLVGRLDRLTSGIVLVARTRAMHAALQRVLAHDASRKDYLAVVHGRIGRPRGTLDLRLHRDDRDRRRVVASATRGAASRTAYERLARSREAGLALLRCRLMTGRMHQIRVHLAAAGWPIVGDPVYGEPRWGSLPDGPIREAVRLFPRQALHAWRMAFTHPTTGRRVRLEAPVPPDLAALLSVAGMEMPHVVPDDPRLLHRDVQRG